MNHQDCKDAINNLLNTKTNFGIPIKKETVDIVKCYLCCNIYISETANKNFDENIISMYMEDLFLHTILNIYLYINDINYFSYD